MQTKYCASVHTFLCSLGVVTPRENTTLPGVDTFVVVTCRQLNGCAISVCQSPESSPDGCKIVSERL